MIEEWQAVTGGLASSMLVGGAVFGVMRYMLRADFVPRTQHSGLEHRVNTLEKRVEGLPADHDLADLTKRMGAVEMGVAVVQTSVEGVNAGMKRVEHTVGLLLQHQLRKEE